jgi:hypothetical protein
MRGAGATQRAGGVTHRHGRGLNGPYGPYAWADGVEPDSANPLRMKTETIAGNLYNKVVTRKPQTDGTAKGRDLGFQVGVTGDLDQDYDVTYAYDDENEAEEYTGRMKRITGPGLTSKGVVYGYAGGMDFVGSVEFQDADDETAASITRTFNSDEYEFYSPTGELRDVLTCVENKIGAQTVSKYTYIYDELGRREYGVNEGYAFAASAYNEYGYSDRSELDSSYRYDLTTFDEVPAERRLYDYDNIGNRESHTDGDVTPPGVTYTSNALNQYAMTRGFVESFAYDLDGNMTKSGLAAGDYDDDGDVDNADFLPFQACFNGPNRPSACQ